MKFMNNYFRQTHRDKIVQFFIASFLMFSLLTLVTENSLFPFVKFRMFSRLIEEPKTKSYFLFGVDSRGNEEVIKKNYVYPMTFSELFKKIAFSKTIQVNNRIELVFDRAHKDFSHLKKIRLYEVECNCFDFYEKENKDSLLDFASKNCTRNLYKEKLYE